ncbi:MAG: glycoside hydrolase family 3 C-terminal domain-containing protein [bacterium]
MAKQQKQKFPYQDTKLSFEERVNDLVSRMTSEEKVSQMLHNSPEIKRLGIMKYDWWNECLHGVARAGIATVFPQAIGLAATFNEELINSVANAISDEARAKYHKAINEGVRETYYGLTFWSPNINIFRDPRWGRGQETYGEDPYLTSRIGAAFVKGLQGNDTKYLKTAACAKHFAVHSGPEALRHTFDAIVTEKDLRETYLPAFKTLVKEAKVEAVMGAYNRTLGESCVASKRLLTDILRNEWGFNGHVVSDCGAIQDIYQSHKLTKTAAEAAGLATINGCDLNCCLSQSQCSEADKGLKKAMEYSILDQSYIDRAVKRLLMTRFKLGMFDLDKNVKYSKIPYSVVDSPKHRQLALETARQSIVLLKNEGVLPLKNIKSIGIVGPNADDVEALLGNYYGSPSKWLTPLAGIKKIVGSKVKVTYIKGCNIKDVYSDHLTALKETFKNVDVITAFLGLNAMVEGEEGAGDGDRQEISLMPAQTKMLEVLCSLGKPVIVILLNGSAIAFDINQNNIKAVIEAWYPGEEGGTAIAEVLFGKYNPAGRLPITFYKSVQDLPDFRDYRMDNRTYRYYKGEPLFPFGFGLSYTKFEYTKLKVQKNISPDKTLKVSVEVKNVGTMDGDEVVQIYIKTPLNTEATPLLSLCAMKRLSLKKKTKKNIEFIIEPEQIGVYMRDGSFNQISGTYTLCVGGVQPGYEKTAYSTEVLSKRFNLSNNKKLKQASTATKYSGLQVKGRHIYDSNEEKLVIRGVNKMVVWLDPDGIPSFSEIAKTGANCVRIVWSVKDGTMEGLDIAIQNCVKYKMIPVIELHDHTGNWDDSVFELFNNYWTDPKMLSIIKKHESYLIINYANEIGNNLVTNLDYKKRYNNAVKTLRKAGIRVPLMIDAAAWGTGMNYITDNWEYLQKNDPLHNLIFSIHMWWNDGDSKRIKDAIWNSVKTEIPLVVGEFAVAGIDNKGLICYQTIIAECQKAQIGWLAWEWGPGNMHGNLMDMTKNNKYESLWGWSKEVCVSSPYSIKNTSIKLDIF